MTPEQLSKLPKFAQEYIRSLRRERDVSVRAMNEWQDGQTVAPVYYQEYVSSNEEATGGPSLKTVYVQTRKITMEHAGVEVELMIRGQQIDIRWGLAGDRGGDVAFIPSSYQAGRVVSRENMYPNKKDQANA